jgi:hypothetical protein
MNFLRTWIPGTFGLLAVALTVDAEIKTVVNYNDRQQASAAFKFETVPAPRKGDAASKAQFSIVNGAMDPSGGSLDKLHDGRLPTSDDEPSANFFFNAGTAGGRLAIDLGSAITVKQINTFSWHASARGPQVYELYGNEGTSGELPPAGKDADLAKLGWKLITKVDTRPKEGSGGGQYGVSISDSEGALGKFRYLLFDMARTEARDSFGNTFYSEIDVIDRDAPETAEPEPPAKPITEIVKAADGKYEITLDTTLAPDLTEWAHNELAPVVREWYPKLVEMLPSEGYEATNRVTIVFREGRRGIPAYAGNGRITCNMDWFRGNLKGEAKGAVVHEMAHVVQHYGWGRARNPNATRTPGWIVEGIPDYIRWFLYEPQSKGAEITARNISRAKYDANYRITGNFINWVTEKYDRDIVRKLNAAARDGKYTDDLWKTYTGKTVQELGDEWKQQAETKIAATSGAKEQAKTNALTPEEKKAGWQLLFDGNSLDGWHNFKTNSIRPGWQVKEGVLVCVDPHNAGDLCTKDQFDWFELQLDYNISTGGNSGIMFHVTEQGRSAWATGPEVQLEDNKEARDPQRCGWLYGLYQPAIDPKTDKPIDATKPAGEWNHIRVLITPEKCEHEINGVKYFEYVLGSEDFNQRVAKSKFGKMPLFAKSNVGFIALQGDHGQVSFRNIKIRPITAAK